MYLSGAALPGVGKNTPGQEPLSGPANGSLVQSITQALGSAMQIYNQQRLANYNLERLRAGQQPITFDQWPGLVPTVQVQAGLDQQTRGTSMLVLGGLAAVAALLLLRKRKR